MKAINKMKNHVKGYILDISIQWLKKLFQCLAILKRLTCHKSNKIDNNLKIIYEILDHLGFQTSTGSCDLDKN